MIVITEITTSATITAMRIHAVRRFSVRASSRFTNVIARLRIVHILSSTIASSTMGR
jgi:hypothetical protein